jgi:hypothetical protein
MKLIERKMLFQHARAIYPHQKFFCFFVVSLSSGDTGWDTSELTVRFLFGTPGPVLLLVNISDFVQREIPLVEQNTKIAGRHLENWR